MFISLNVEPQTHEAAVAALDALRAELEANGVSVKEGSWGYRLLVVDDPDGNQHEVLYGGNWCDHQTLTLATISIKTCALPSIGRRNSASVRARNRHK